MNTRRCTRCNNDFPEAEFRTYQSGKRHRKICRRCENVRRREVSINSPERLRQMRETRFLNQYGITLSEYEDMVLERGGRCDIRGMLPNDNRGSKLHVDHEEGTVGVRGLLCLRCNVGIGMLQHDPDLMLEAYRYLGGQ